MVRMTQYLVEKYCSIKIYQKSHQTIKKKEFEVLHFLAFCPNSQVKMWIVNLEVIEANRGHLILLIIQE